MPLEAPQRAEVLKGFGRTGLGICWPELWNEEVHQAAEFRPSEEK